MSPFPLARQAELRLAELYDDQKIHKWRKGYLYKAMGFIDAIYVPECRSWVEAYPTSRAFTTQPPSSSQHVPMSVVAHTWSDFPNWPCIPDDGDYDPFFYPPIHVQFHGHFVDFAPKLPWNSTPHAVANFNGCDLPSLQYEDFALYTVPALLLTHNTYVHIVNHAHPYYNSNVFHGLVPPLCLWNEYLEHRFRGAWTSRDVDIRIVPGALRVRKRSGDCLDVDTLYKVGEIKEWGDLDGKVNGSRSCVGYENNTRHLWWLDATNLRRFTYWPSSESVLAELVHQMEKPVELVRKVSTRGLYRQNLQRRMRANLVKEALSSTGNISHSVRVRRPRAREV
ncbi:hypothetical protein BKA82DRAFT_4354209 [Pisolithus tinctorius]|nr:hypothetical protein BKA82DRAFT_4354209 [Pisolithus tinctorius]